MRTIGTTTMIAGSALTASAATGTAATETPPLLSLCLSSAPLVRPADLWASWSLAPEIVLPLLAFVAWRIRTARRPLPALIALALLAIALVSPLCRLSAVLASAHMVQHALLVTLAPMALALAAPRPLPRRGPLPLVTAAYGAAIWFWHVPAAYEAALADPVIHLVMVGSLLALSEAFWRRVLHAREGAGGTATLALLATMIHTGLLGAVLTFAGAPWYGTMAQGALAWGLDPLADQQLAGLIMWVPMAAIYLGAALVLVGRLLVPSPRGTPG